MPAQLSLMQHVRTGYRNIWNAIPSWVKKASLAFPLVAGAIQSLATSNYSWEQAKTDHQAGDEENHYNSHSEALVTSNYYITGRLKDTIPNTLIIAEIETAAVVTGTFLTGMGLVGSYCVAKCRARNNRSDLNVDLVAPYQRDVEMAEERVQSGSPRPQ